MLGTVSDLWVYVLVPVLTLILTAGLVYGTMHPLLKEHREHEQARLNREMRIDATCDAVLGADAVPHVGRGRVVGLVEISAQNKKVIEGLRDAIGPINGSGRSAISLLEEVSRSLKDHIADDDRRFGEIRR